LHASSYAEAITALKQEKDIAVILLDVVMETEDAGLRLVRSIREDLQMQALRIVLRTGQPGYAPELQVIREFDINDYRNKSELTRNRLVTCLTTAIRSFLQIRTLNQSHKRLESIVKQAPALFSILELERFAEKALALLATQLDSPPDQLLFMVRSADAAWQTVSSTGSPANPNIAQQRPDLSLALKIAIQTRQSLYDAPWSVLLLEPPSAPMAALAINTGDKPEGIALQLLEIFRTTLQVALEDIELVQRLQRLAYTDPVCRIGNRTRFVQQLDEMFVCEGGEQNQVLLFDIDHFSQINDALGLPIGDALLRSMAERLNTLVPATVAIARINSDVIALAGPAGQLDQEKLRTALQAPFQIDDHQIRIQITMAGAHLSDTEPDGVGCLKDATLALNLAKRTQRSQTVWFSPTMRSASRERLALLLRLEEAIRNNELSVHYQPQLHLETGRLVGLEALMRWQQADGSFIPPSRFIALAEQSGLIIELGEWLFSHVCRQVSQWLQNGCNPRRVAINVSMLQFNHNDLIHQLSSQIKRYQLPAGIIEIEITESAAMQNPDHTISRIRELQSLGVLLSIDDFGTGFSSLSYLQKIRADRIKIDRSFIRDIDASDESGSISEMIINLGHKLGFSVLAEGVETREQAAILKALGCDEVQGFLFSHPLPPAALEDWLQGRIHT
jgi:diguanylate cyclase (GGDEF)-like protein